MDIPDCTFENPRGDTLFISSIPRGTTQASLIQLFGTENVSMNAEKGFAFVRFTTTETAYEMAKKIKFAENSSPRSMKVDFAKPRPTHTSGNNNTHISPTLLQMYGITHEVREDAHTEPGTGIRLLSFEALDSLEDSPEQRIIFDIPSWTTPTHATSEGPAPDSWIKKLTRYVETHQTMENPPILVFAHRLPTGAPRDPRALFKRDRSPLAALIKPHVLRVSTHDMREHTYLIVEACLKGQSRLPPEWKYRVYQEEDTLSNLPALNLPPYHLLSFHLPYADDLRFSIKKPTTHNFILQEALKLFTALKITDLVITPSINRATGMLKHTQHPAFAFTALVHRDALPQIRSAACGANSNVPWYAATPVAIMDSLGLDGDTHHSFVAITKPEKLLFEAEKIQATIESPDLWIYPAGFGTLEIFVQKAYPLAETAKRIELNCFDHEGKVLQTKPTFIFVHSPPPRPLPANILFVFPFEKGSEFTRDAEVTTMQAALTSLCPGANSALTFSKKAIILRDLAAEETEMWNGWVGYLNTSVKVRILAKGSNPVTAKTTFRKKTFPERQAIEAKQMERLIEMQKAQALRVQAYDLWIDQPPTVPQSPDPLPPNATNPLPAAVPSTHPSHSQPPGAQHPTQPQQPVTNPPPITYLEPIAMEDVHENDAPPTSPFNPETSFVKRPLQDDVNRCSQKKQKAQGGNGGKAVSGIYLRFPKRGKK